VAGGAAFVAWLKTIKQQIGIAPNLSAVGVKSEQVPRMVEIATADICHQTNPRPCVAADFERLFAKAM
jgi:alcohol dehydrogenase class IV